MLLSFLSVVGIRTMLTVVMFLDEQGVHRRFRIERERDVSHLGTLFHHLGIVNGVGRAGTP